jgi:hypothetical protein
MNADKRGLKMLVLSALIRVNLRPDSIFSQLLRNSTAGPFHSASYAAGFSSAAATAKFLPRMAPLTGDFASYGRCSGSGSLGDDREKP